MFLGIGFMVSMLIRVGVLAVIWTLWLCRNDKIFNNKNYSLLQVIYRCTGRSPLQRMENRGLFIEVCTRLKATARDTFFLHEWPHNLRIGAPPSPYAIYNYLICILPFLFFYFSSRLMNGCVHLGYAEVGCNCFFK
jgi:hypothetical protein